MTINITGTAPFIRTSRNFPADTQALTVELDRTYIDTASYINSRVIGTVPATNAAITGEKWVLQNNQPQDTFRQAYNVTGTGPIPHGINLGLIGGFTRVYGAVYDGTNWYPLPNGNITITITSTNITFTTSVAIISGQIVIEWLSLN